MMRRTKSAQDSTIVYNNAKASITFSPTHPRDDLPIFQVRFHFAPGGKFDSFLHFHTYQTEYLYCEKGEIRVTLGQVIRVVGPEDGMIVIKPWVVHRWETLGGGETIVWEKADPDPETKETFFRNIFGAVNDHKEGPPFLQMFKFFADYDNYPVGAQVYWEYVKGPIKVAVGFIGWIATLVGFESAYAEYTPSYLNTAKR